MKKRLIVEGNLREENQSFSEAGIQTHTESLKDSLAYFTDKLETHVINPSSDENIDKNIDSLESYDGLIWGGSSLNIYNNTPEIKSKIEFMTECPKKLKKNKFLNYTIKAFQRRFRRELINGKIDQECLLISKNLAKKLN